MIFAVSFCTLALASSTIAALAVMVSEAARSRSGMSAADFGMEFDQFENHPEVIVRMNGRLLAVDVGVECLKALGLPGLYDLAKPFKVGEHRLAGKECLRRFQTPR